MLKLGRVTKVKEFFLVLVYVFNIDLFEFSVAILEKGLLRVDRGYRSRCSDQHLTTDTFCNMSIPDNYLLFGENTENVHLFSTHAAIENRICKHLLKYIVFVTLTSYSVFSKLWELYTYIPCCSFFFQRGFVSGSGDSSVKFWEFELVSDAQHSQVR